MGTFPSIRPLVSLLQTRPHVAPLLVEAFEKSFKMNVCRPTECLVQQAVSANAVPALLHILDGNI